MSGPISKPKKRKRPARRNYMAQADALFSKFIRTRDGRCVECGTTEFLQCAHIISRSYKTIRVDPDNAVALCRAHHTYFTHHPLEWELWVEARFPGRLVRLRAKALTHDKVDWKAEVEWLKREVT